MDDLLKKRYTTDVDKSHGFLSTRGSKAAKDLTTRVLLNHKDVKDYGELRSIPGSTPENFRVGIERHHAVAEALREIDLDDWHKFSDLNERDEEGKGIFITSENPSDSGDDPDELDAEPDTEEK